MAPPSLLLLLSLGFVTVSGKSSFPAIMGSTIYRIGLVALAVGIALEIYGFYLRVRISSWAPVTNMYETVIWVALVAAVLSFVFEMIYRKMFTALAGAGVALLGTIVAANVPLLDPSIKSLQPVLRDNFWLSTHVLCVVSSYAAFGLAWMLGLVATVYYLTATYRQSPRFRDLALALIPGLLLLAGGGAGVAAVVWNVRPAVDRRRRAGLFQRSDAAIGGDTLFYVFATMALLGETITLAGLLALGGEVVNRLTFRPEAEQETEVERHSQVKLDPRAPGDAAHRGDRQAPVQLHLPRDAGRRALGRGRHDPGRRLGRLLVGPVLGLGPERGLGTHHLAGLPDSAPRPVRRLGQHVRPGRRIGRLLPVGHHGLVRRELRAGRRAAQLRLRRRGLAGNHEHDHHGRAQSPGRRRLAPVLGAAAGGGDPERARVTPKHDRDRSRSRNAKTRATGSTPRCRIARGIFGDPPACSAHSSRFKPRQ